jgi:hypothetical protein
MKFSTLASAPVNTTVVLMPKATVDKDHFSKGWKHEVGAAREAFSVQPKPVTQAVRQ